MKTMMKWMYVAIGTIAFSYTSYGAGTISGTTISNQAAVAFSVGGSPQTPVNSNTLNFVVDSVVSFTVTSNGNTNVVPGATGRVLQFTVASTANLPLDFGLTATNSAGDDFNPSSFAVFAENGVTVGYQAGQDTLTYIDELPADGSRVVYVVSTIPGTPVNGDDAIMHLQAIARAAGVALTQGAVLVATVGAETAGTVDIVFNDGAGTATGDVARDGTHSDDGSYLVVTASIAVTKSSTVISDPVNGVTNPKRLPGAVVQYTISVQNTGGAQADNLSITDTLAATTTFVPGSILVDAIAEDDNNSAADETDPNGANFAAGVVTATILALPAAATKTVVFRVTIN